MEAYRWMMQVWGAYKPRGGNWIQFTNGQLVMVASGAVLAVWGVFAAAAWMGARHGKNGKRKV